MVESAFMTALFGVVVTVLYLFILSLVGLAVMLVGLIGGFIWHLWDNRKAKRIARGK